MNSKEIIITDKEGRELVVFEKSLENLKVAFEACKKWYEK